MMDVTDFSNLVITEHRDKVRFMETLSGVLAPFVTDLNYVLEMPSLYDVDAAVGVQLDTVGEWVGVPRRVALPITAYFSWDTDGLGWDQAIWWEVGDATTSITTLADTIYRELIYAKIACNEWDGSAATALQIIQTWVAPDGCSASLAEGTMTATFTITGSLSVLRKGIIEAGYLPFNPAGVSVSYTFSAS